MLGARARVVVLAASLAVAGAAAGAATAPPPTGGLIAFDRQLGEASWAIGLIGPTGGAARLLQLRVHGGHDPAWSPDGRSIAFGSWGFADGGIPDGIWVVDANGRGLRRVATADDPSDPTWSPDGRRIAFSATGIQGAGCCVRKVYVVDARGTRLRQAIARPRLHVDEPAWSPDGRSIAVRVRSLFAATGEIALARPDGTGLHAITSTGGRDPAWSPDGRLIAYEGLFGSEIERTIVIRPDGTGRRPVGDPRPGGDQGPSWSPDGRWLVVASTRRTRPTAFPPPRELFLISLDGRQALEISPRPDIDTDPAWSPAAGNV